VPDWTGGRKCGQYRDEEGRGAAQLHPLIAAGAAAFEGDGKGLAHRCLSMPIVSTLALIALKVMASSTVMDELRLAEVSTIRAGIGYGVGVGPGAGTEVWAVICAGVGGGSLRV
jgi:hypothetical protein